MLQRPARPLHRAASSRPLVLACALAILAVLSARPARAGEVDPGILRMAAAQPRSTVIAWVRFTDRAGAERAADVAARACVSPRSLERRALRGTLRGVDASDLPVYEPYVRALVERGARLRGTSRWLNAASLEMPAGLAAELARLPFVAEIVPVPVAAPMTPVGEVQPVPASELGGPRAAGATSLVPERLELAPGDTAYYGGSFKQLAMMQVPQMHSVGLTGAGVLVCMLDTGAHLAHRVFRNLHVLAKRDFVFGDTIVDDQVPPDVFGQCEHGTWTLACVAGSLPGVYTGGAFGATVALGKTEYVPTETPVEMDYWQMGAEWADSLGADLISSSLGYSQFDSPWPSYTYADMNGRTTVVTLAAVEATRRGITVVDAAGNEGGTAWHFIVAPGDADSIVTVGAVDSTNLVTGFSSRGPTSDGRTKPDVTAMGLSVLLPAFSNDSTYIRASGTSFSTPLTAGVVALLLQAHPSWGPWEVREALRTTALNHASPDNNIGWGLVQGMNAYAWPQPTTVPKTIVTTRLSIAAAPNPLRAGTSLTVRFAAPRGEPVTVDVVDLAGRRVTRLFSGEASQGREAFWDGRYGGGAVAPAGLYWVRVDGGGESRSTRIALLR